MIEQHSVQALARRHRLLVLFRQRPDRKPILTLSDVRDDFEQFRVWAKHLGVFATDNSSLDYRLRDAAEIRRGIASLLRTISIDSMRVGSPQGTLVS